MRLASAERSCLELGIGEEMGSGMSPKASHCISEDVGLNKLSKSDMRRNTEGPDEGHQRTTRDYEGHHREVV